MITTTTVLSICAVILNCCRLAPAAPAFKNEFAAEHRFEARGSLPKRDLRREPVFLFIGVLSTLESKGRRDNIRRTWGKVARSDDSVDLRFFLEAPDKAASQQELAAQKDLAYVPSTSNYRTAVIKSYYIMEYAHLHHNCHFILKADEDTFVNVKPLVAELQMMCKDIDCQHGKLYVGHMMPGGTVNVLDMPDGKPSRYFNAPFFNRTGLEHYPSYMMGGGYLVTSDIASSLVAVNSLVGLSVFHLEDANFGFWLSPWDVHYVDHPQMSVIAIPVVERGSADGSNNFSLRHDLASSNYFCSDHPWLVLHKVMDEEMGYLMSLTDRCGGAPQASSRAAAQGHSA